MEAIKETNGTAAAANGKPKTIGEFLRRIIEVWRRLPGECWFGDQSFELLDQLLRDETLTMTQKQKARYAQALLSFLREMEAAPPHLMKTPELNCLMAAVREVVAVNELETFATPAADPTAERAQAWTTDDVARLLADLEIPVPCGGVPGSVKCVITPVGTGGALPTGYLLQLRWIGRPANRLSGNAYLTGAKFYLSKHAAKNEIVQAVFAAVVRASEHEIRETFKYRGVALYRPHQPVDALAQFTATAPPELRANNTTKRA